MIVTVLRLNRTGLPYLCVLLTVILLLVRPLTGQSVLLPGEQLRHIHPWTTESRPPWNVLQFDGIAQFLPWRTEVVRQFREGHLPVGNPNSFATLGGAPLLANSQSAPFYPPNLLFTALGERNVPQGFGILLAFHLALMGFGMVRLLTGWGLSATSATIGSLTSVLNIHLIAWTPISTHVSVLAWAPWVLHAISRRNAIVAGSLMGISLLGGHLQIGAFLLGLVLFAEFWMGRNEGWIQRLRRIAVVTAMAIGISAIQFIPALELGGQSHRGGVSPTAEGYLSYVNNAVPIHFGLAMLAPDLFGNPSKGNGANWIVSASGQPNAYAEWVSYIGLAGLVFLITGLTLYVRGNGINLWSKAGWIPIFLGFAVCIGFGSQLNRVLYFMVPGFASTGNPGRIMGVAIIPLSILAAIGAEYGTRKRHGLAAGLIAVAAVILTLITRQLAGRLELDFEWVGALAAPAVMTALLFGVLAAVAIAFAYAPKSSRSARWFVVFVLGLDLFVAARGNLAESSLSDLAPRGQGIRWLQDHAGTKPVAFINRGWTMNTDGPADRHPIVPPNLPGWFGFRDVAGYDSLILRSTKDAIRAAHDGDEPSPPENGNLVFVKSLDAAYRLNAQFVVLPAIAEPELSPNWSVKYRDSDIVILEWSTERKTDSRNVNWLTTSVRVGIFLTLSAILVWIGHSVATFRGRKIHGYQHNQAASERRYS